MNFYKTIRVRQSNKHKMTDISLKKLEILKTYIQRLKDKDPTLTKLNISYFILFVNVDDIKVLASTLTNNTNLTHLDMSSNNIGDEGAIELGLSLTNNTTLQNLDISCNSIGSKGTWNIVRVISNSLRYFNISSNKIGVNGVIYLSFLIKERLLTTLIIENNDIEHKGARRLSEALKVNTSLTELDISHNNIGDEGTIALAEALGEGGNTTLTKLDISYNKIGKGASHLAKALKENKTLMSLNIETNSSGDEEIKAIAEALCEGGNTTLTELDISYNHLGNNGLAALINTLKENKTLRKLNISSYDYSISLEKLIAVKEAIKDNSTLIYLNMIELLYSFESPNESLVQIYEKIKRNEEEYKQKLINNV